MPTVTPLPRKNERGVYGLTWAPGEAIHQVRVFTLGDLVKGLRRAARELEAMARDGVVLGLMGHDALSDEGHQHYRLLTTDLAVARRHGFEGLPEAETSRGEQKKPADVIVLPLGGPSRFAQRRARGRSKDRTM